MNLKLLFVVSLFFASELFAESIIVERLQTYSATYRVQDPSAIPDYWMLEREVTFEDARMLALYLVSFPGTQLRAELIPVAKKPSRRRVKTLRRRKPHPFNSSNIEFIGPEGDAVRSLSVPLNSFETGGTGFILPDACKKKGRYILRIWLDFTSADRVVQPTEIFLQTGISQPPRSQATLFKFPSEKDPSKAVLLMKTSFGAKQYVHLSYSERGKRRDYISFPVQNYFFSGLHIYTRIYLEGALLTGRRVSAHHISADFTQVYSVCLTLAKRRQQLEGYR